MLKFYFKTHLKCWSTGIFLLLIFSTAQHCSGTVNGNTDVTAEKNQLLDGHQHVVVCCISVLAQSRDTQRFLIQDFDPTLCTIVLLTDISINKESGKLHLPRNLSDWANLKIKSPHLNTSLSIGEHNDTSLFTSIAANHTLRKILIDDIINKTIEMGFDSVDLNLAYINHSKKMAVFTLVKELRDSLSTHGLTLTATLGSSNIANSHDLEMLNPLLHFIHLLGFNYHGAWDTRTGPNAPLQSTDHTDKLTVMASVEFLLTLGVPQYKILLGVPMFGRSFDINTPEDEGLKVAFNYKTLALGPLTFEDGFMGYNKICLELNSENGTWKKSWDDISKTPYAHNEYRWISYDDERSIKYKSFFAIQNGLAGLMAWRVDLDDFRGDCSDKNMAEQRFPLLNAINIAMIEALESSDLITNTLGKNTRDLSIPIGITVAVLLCAVLAMFIRLLHLRINSTCPTFY